MFILRLFQRIHLLHFYIESQSDFSYNLANWIFFGGLLLFILLYLISLPEKLQKKLRPVRIAAKICLAISLCQFCFSAFTGIVFGESWGTPRYFYDQSMYGPPHISRIMIDMFYSELKLPENYIYDGYFSQEYFSELINEYSDIDETEVMQRWFSTKHVAGLGGMFVSDPLKPGDYYWQRFSRDHHIGYTGSAYRIYINNPEGFVVIWGVGINLKYDLTREKIDQLYQENNLRSLKDEPVYIPGKRRYNHEYDFPVVIIKSEKYSDWRRMW